MTPLISIILPTYNRAGYLPRAVRSVLRQTYTHWELIIVDDHSRDNSVSILRRLFRDRRIRIVRLNQHVGVPRAVNAGMRLTRGSYLTFIDSDDAFTPGRLRQHLGYMQRHPEVDLMHGGVRVVGSPYVPDKYNPRRGIHVSRVALRPTFFGKIEVFRKLRGFKNLAYSEESEFLERAERKFTIRRVNFPTYVYYRDVPGSITQTVARKNKR